MIDPNKIRFESRTGGHIRLCHECHERVEEYMVAVNQYGYVLAVVRLCEKHGGAAKSEVMLAARLRSDGQAV